jgi:hypothetical protein
MPSLVIARGFATVVLAALVGMLVAGLGGGCGNNSLSAGAPADGAAPTVVAPHPDADVPPSPAPSSDGGRDAGPLPTPDQNVPPPAHITPTEAVKRIAAVLWNAPPDESVPTPATLDEVPGVVRQLLDDPRAAAGVGAFYRWWLDLPDLARTVRDPVLFPSFTPELRADMAVETETFGVNVTLALNGSFTTLLTANFSFIDARLADLYGVSGVAGDSFQQVYLPTGERAGLLTQPALQTLGAYANRTSPAHRGTYISKRFFCAPLPAAPPNVPALDPIPPGVTVRQQEEMHLTAANCSACHNYIDPLGFAFEGFDAMGRARTIDNGQPVDVSNLSVEIQRADEGPVIEGPIDGPIELAMLVAANPRAQDCMVRQWLSFALGRDLQDADSPTVDDLDRRFAAANFNLKTLVSDVLLSDTFLSP